MRTRPAVRAASGRTAAVIVYSQRLREAYRDVPIVIGGIEASLRRIAHFDYWSEKVRRSVLLDAKADLLVYGNAERQIVRDRAVACDAGEAIGAADATCAAPRSCAATPAGGSASRSTRRHLDAPGPLNPPVDPYAMEPEIKATSAAAEAAARPRPANAWCKLRAAREERPTARAA